MVMKRRFLTTALLGLICLIALIGTITSGQTQAVRDFDIPRLRAKPAATETQPTPISNDSGISTNCALQPEISKSRSVPPRTRINFNVPLSRFRQEITPPANPDVPDASNKANTGYTPREEVALIDSSNYGDRFLRDVNGNPATLEPIVVLHETVGSANSAINFFRNYHPNDADQASYHSLIRLNGTVVYLVPPDKRAYGAGNSVFIGPNGVETVQTKPKFPPSVNNFAYHISLETPADGEHNGSRHSGYTQAQYQSLAWLVAKTGVPDERITTHKGVDRSRSRMDPRSFNTDRFFKLLSTFPRTNEISIRCTDPTT